METSSDILIQLRTSVYPSNLAPISVKLWQRTFRTICNFRFFDAESFLIFFGFGNLCFVIFG